METALETTKWRLHLPPGWEPLRRPLFRALWLAALASNVGTWMHEVGVGGAEVTLIDLKDFPLPLFDQDLEAQQGMPENGKKLKKLFIDHDGLLLASPEHNSSITPVLKKALDWVSR